MANDQYRIKSIERLDHNKRETAADEVFHNLMSEIISLKISPGTKLSEAEVARSFGVSRQPVREAFMKLSDLDLLHIRPQKATVVKKISLTDIAHTRFIRSAVEVEVVRVASEVASETAIANLRDSLEQQAAARLDGDARRLQVLDYEFHRLICEAANQRSAFAVISEYKAHTDRICRLEMNDDDGMGEVIAGHTAIVDAIAANEPDQATECTREHLAHLDATIKSAEQKFPHFFEV